MRPYVTVLPLGTLRLDMKKIVFFPFGMRVPTPWDSLPRLLANASTHISDSGICRNFLYSCDIPVMGSMPVLDSNLMKASCDVRICVARAYLGVFWNCGDCRGTDGFVIGTLGDGAVVGICVGSTLGDCAVLEIGDGTTLGDGAVVGICDVPIGGNAVGALVGRDVASIPCRVFMACICSSLTANGDAGTGLLSASARSSTAWRAASFDVSFGTGQLCRKKYTVLTILSVRVAGT